MKVYLPFSKNEYQHRLKIARQTLAREGIDCCVAMAPETQFYLTGYDTFLGALLPQALIFTPKNDELTLVLWDADVALARESTWVTDIRTYMFGVDEPVDAIADVVHQKSPRGQIVGFDGQSRAVTYSIGKSLEQALGSVELVDCTELLATNRLVKSSEEIVLMRRAGAHTRAGLEAAKRFAKPGVSEIALAAEIEYAMRRSGSDYWAIPTELASGSRSVCGHGTPRGRVLEPGDLVHIEIGGVEQRYNAVGMQTLAVGGRKPSKAAQDLYETALRCLRAGLAQIKPGVVAADVEAPALELLEKAGYGDCLKMRFGYGVGIGYPPSWLEPLHITRTSRQRLDVGTTFVLHACLLDHTENLGVLVGGAYAVATGGFELLSGAGDVELEMRKR